MSKSIDNLEKLTKQISEYGVKITIIKSVDEKLVEATTLIKDAQATLAAASVIRDDLANEVKNAVSKAEAINDGKDQRIQELVTEAENVLKTTVYDRDAASASSDSKDNRIQQLVVDLNKSVADLKTANETIDRIHNG